MLSREANDHLCRVGGGAVVARKIHPAEAAAMCPSPRKATPKMWMRTFVLASTALTLAGCFDPAKDTCAAADVVSKMLDLVEHSFGFLAVEGIELSTNGFKGSDGKNAIRYRERFGEVRTEGYDDQARTASCTGVFHFQVAPHGNDQAPDEAWSKHDLGVKYQVKLTDKNEFRIGNSDWDWQ